MSNRQSKKRLTQADRLDALRSSVDERINALCNDRGEWVNICRKTLLEMEKRNIQRRAKNWTELVNEKVKDTNSRLSLSSATFENVTKKFEYIIDDCAMDKHLNFIIGWKGLKTRQIQNAPKTYLEFENKAKNWLNGRRAPNYALTLFPSMIKASEIYADYISRQIFANNARHSKLYCRICIIGFLSSLCSARISLNDASKKAYLICENSVKTGKTAVSQILQRYASDHPYQDKFPSHLREASDYFENKYMELISDFAIELNQKQRAEKLNCAQNIGGHVLDIINGTDTPSQGDSNGSVHSASGHSNPSLPNNGTECGLPSSVTHSIMKDITNCDGNLNAISMSIDQFNKLAQFLSGMISNQKTQQNTINDLVQRVQHLESQQQKILKDVTSNSPRSMSSNNQVAYSNHTNSNTPPQCSYNRNPQQQIYPQQQHVQQQFIPVNNNINMLPNNARVSPSESHTTKTTDSGHSLQSQQYHIVNANGSNHVQHHMRNINGSQRMQHDNVVGVPQMNHIATITNLPVPQITNVNMRENGNNMHNVIATPPTQMYQHHHPNGHVNNPLPTTSLYGGYDSNDGDANMFGFGNNQSFNSSDAGMNGIMSSIPNQFDGSGGIAFGRLNHSDQSMTLRPTSTITNIMHYNQ